MPRRTEEPEAPAPDEAAPATVRLHFIGNGRRYVIGVPTADCEVPADRAEALIETGLYELAHEGDTTEGPSTATAPTATESAEAPIGD